jgi:DNA primase
LDNFESVKEKVRQAVSLVEVVSEHVALRPAGRSLKGRCPFHQERTPSFNVTPDRGIFKCFGCGVGGDVFKFVQLIEKVDFMDALRMLADRAGIEMPALRLAKSQRADERGPSRADIARLNAWASSVYQRALKAAPVEAPARQFLEAKGLSHACAEAFGLGLAPSDGNLLLRAVIGTRFDPQWLVSAGFVASGERGDRYEVFRDRLMFPIRDTMNRVIGFGGRTLADARAKYINSAQNDLFDKGRNLYGLDLARPAIVESRSAIVVEGYTDCMAAHQHGFTNTVASLGTAMTDAHAALLSRYCDSVILLFDSDLAGETAADRALAVAMHQGLRVKLARVPSGKDPCDFLQLEGAEGFGSVLNSAEDALGFKWKRTLTRFASPSGGTDRRAAMAEFISFIADMGRHGAVDAIQRGLIINEVSRVVNSPPEDIQRMLVQAGRRRAARPGVEAQEPATAETRIGSIRVQPSDAEQAALVTVLEVLLNAPSLWPEACQEFEPNRFRDAALREIGERVREWAACSGDRGMGGLLGSIESTQEASLVTDLLVRGERRGDFQETLRSATVRLERIRAEREGRSAAARLWTETAEAPGDSDALLREFGNLTARLARDGTGRPFSRRLAEDHEASPQE